MHLYSQFQLRFNLVLSNEFLNEWTASDLHFDHFSKMTKSVSFSSFLILNVEVKAREKYDCFGSFTLDCHFGM